MILTRKDMDGLALIGLAFCLAMGYLVISIVQTGAREARRAERHNAILALPIKTRRIEVAEVYCYQRQIMIRTTDSTGFIHSVRAHQYGLPVERADVPASKPMWAEICFHRSEGDGNLVIHERVGSHDQPEVVLLAR